MTQINADFLKPFYQLITLITRITRIFADFFGMILSNYDSKPTLRLYMRCARGIF
jgi:hypothetical protein